MYQASVSGVQAGAYISVCGGGGGGGGGDGGWQGEVQVTCTFAAKNSGGRRPEVVGVSPPDLSASHGLPLPGNWLPEAPTQTCCPKHSPGCPSSHSKGCTLPSRPTGTRWGRRFPGTRGFWRAGRKLVLGRPGRGMTFPCVPPLGAARRPASQPGSRTDVWPRRRKQL